MRTAADRSTSTISPQMVITLELFRPDSWSGHAARVLAAAIRELCNSATASFAYRRQRHGYRQEFYPPMDPDLDDACPRAPARTGLSCALVGALALLSTDAVGGAPTVSELRAAFSSRDAPRLAWQDQSQLSILVAVAPDRLDVSGTCRTGRPVVISGRGMTSRRAPTASRAATRRGSRPRPRPIARSWRAKSCSTGGSSRRATWYRARRGAARWSGPPISRPRSPPRRPATVSSSRPAATTACASI